jgi:hypothetical protein
MTRYLMGSCIYDKISWISHTKCQLFIGQEIYEGSFIFHVIYFNFILSFLLKNKITHGEIWLVENLCFYSIIARFSSSMIDFSTIIKKIYWNRKFHSHYMWIIWSTIFLKPIFHLWRNLSSFENTLITSLTSQGFIWNFFHSSFYQIDKRHTQTPCKILLLP